MDLILEKWNAVLNRLQSDFEVTTARLTAWQIAELKLHKIENGIIYFIVSDKTKGLVDKYEKNFGPQLLVSIIEETNQNYEGLQFITSDDIEEETDDNLEPVMEHIKPKKAILNSSQHANLNSKYTFDTYVVGENNRLAYSSCLAVAEAPGGQYNPLFLYGGPGLGKTHLMNAIAHFIIDNIPDKNILFVNTNDLVNEIIGTVRNTNKNNVVQAMDDMRDKYNNLDVLLLDDIQFIIGKEHTQEEFFHIFNTLYEAGKQIIISSDRPPRELKTLEERLISRFNMGVTTDISSPTYETRRAILDKKNQLERYNMSDEILEYIAKNITTNVRDLEGALKKLVAFSNLYNKEVTLEDAKKELHYLVSPDKPLEITPDFIIKTVAEYYGLTTEDLKSEKRNKNIATARHIAIYLCREYTQLSYKSIGESFGGKDHSTCMNSYKKIEKEYLHQINDTRTVIDSLIKKIKPSDTAH